MKIPKAIKLKSGEWMIRLRVGGKEQYITDLDKTRCERKARAAKSAYQADFRLQERLEKQPTVYSAMTQYIEERENSLSPLTVRGYISIRDHRFQNIINRRLDQIRESEWQRIVDSEALLCCGKTLKNAWGFLRSVAKRNGINLPEVTLSKDAPKPYRFLDYEQIRAFVSAVKDTEYAIPLLLALLSMRISEIDALRWEDIPRNPQFIHVQGARVLTKDNRYVVKEENKNDTSTRAVPILIPELAAAIERDRKPSGKVLEHSQNTLRRNCEKICEENGLPYVGIHGLRHSFASLSYHLRVPQRIAMEIGGWKNDKTMNEIYTQIAKSDIERYKTAMYDFYRGQ
ncbi:MAG: site-specific integrase [Oscillospiraceae bacterium]|nr:site-specific integrase [Oscillospiraceae bacterium]